MKSAGVYNGSPKSKLRNRVIIRLLAISICVGVWGMSEGASAKNFFDWDCESDLTSAGPVLDYSGGATRGNFSCHRGTGCMKLPIPGNSHDGGHVGAELAVSPCYIFGTTIVGGPAIYYRWWMKIVPGFDWGGYKMKASRTAGNTDQGPSSYTGYLHQDGFGVHECDGGQGNPQVPSPGAGGICKDSSGVVDTADSRIVAPFDMRTLADNQWHEYIVMVKPNSTSSSSDAQLKVWIDGGPNRNGTAVTTQYLNWHLHDNASHMLVELWCAWMLRPYAQIDVGAGGTMYVDDFSVDDVYNSLITGGTIPSTPGVVTLQ